MALATTVAGLAPLAGRTRRLLAVFSHPDDESYGAAGTLARIAADPDAAVVLLCLTSGEAASALRNRGLDESEIRTLREARLHEVAGIVGLHGLLLPRLPDSRLARLPFDALSAPATEAIRAFRPQVVIAQDPRGVNGHADHIATHWAVRDALRDRPEIRFGMLCYPPEVAERVRPRLLFPTAQAEIDVVVELSSHEAELKQRCLDVHEAAIRIVADGGDASSRPPVECFDLLGEDFDPPLGSLFERLGRAG